MRLPTDWRRPAFVGHANAMAPSSAARFQGGPLALGGKDTVCFSGTQGVKPVRLIQFDPKQKIFKLSGQQMEYFLQVDKNGELVNLHWGKPIGPIKNLHPELLPHNLTRTSSWQQALDIMPREFPDTGRGDNRTPAIQIRTAQGQSLSQFKYVGHDIQSGKPMLEGLPATFANPGDRAQTLVVHLRDEISKLNLDLNYTTFADKDIIIRSAKLTNTGSEPVTIDKLSSFSADFAPDDYRLFKLSGAAIRERQEEIVNLQQGKFEVSSNLGASGHAQNPFVALLAPDTNEDTGKAYGFSFVYSGSFSAEAEQNRNRYTRLVMGLNPDVFQWKLEPGQSFQTPEAIGIFTNKGLNGLTQEMQRVVQNNVIRSPWKNKPRPVLLNTWEAIGPNINHDKVMEMARETKKMGADMIVLDDGWFGHKYPRTGVDGLGDWVDNPAKLPQGLSALAKDVNELGLQFGIWMEPEMVSPKSELFEQHPDWIIRQPDYAPSPVKHQYILDLGRPEVQDYLIGAISKVLDGGHIQYVKWDMNRTMTEAGSTALPPERQKEAQHRYMLGLYRVLDTLTKKYPDVLWEGCAGGGGRFDPGMLQYFPQIWTSDNTDAVARLNIQAGTARLYPPMTMGSHVSAVPNGQLGRITSMKFRFAVAMSGNLGLELDPAHLTDDEKAYAKEQIGFYKQVRHLVQDGEYRLLTTPFTSNWPAWQFKSKDSSEALLFAFQKLAEANVVIPPVKAKGLVENALYEVTGPGLKIDQPLTGAYLMQIGLTPRFTSDFDAQIYHLKRVS